MYLKYFKTKEERGGLKELKLLPKTCDFMIQFFSSSKSYLILFNDGSFTVAIEITDLNVTH